MARFSVSHIFRGRMTLVPDEWHTTLPTTLVVGEDAYATALAIVVGGSVLRPADVSSAADPAAAIASGYGLLRKLVRVFLLPPNGSSFAAALHGHAGVRALVDKLSPYADQHDLVFVFVLPTRKRPRSSRLWRATCASMRRNCRPAGTSSVGGRTGSSIF